MRTRPEPAAVRNGSYIPSDGGVKEGGILLSVHSDNSDWTKRVKEILERTGADDVSSSGEAKGRLPKNR